MGRRGVIAGVGAAAAAGVLLWRLRPDATRQDGGAQTTAGEPRVVAQLAAWAPAPPTRRAARAASYAWAAPMTAAGLLLGAVANTAPRIHQGALLFAHAGGLAARMLRWRRFSAATLGHVIVALGEPSEELLVHELVHVRQAERFGPLFAPLYLAGLARYGYRANPFERAAYRTADAFRVARPDS